MVGSLAGCPLNDAGFGNASAMLPKLDRLYLSGTKVGDAGMALPGEVAVVEGYWSLQKYRRRGCGRGYTWPGLKTLKSSCPFGKTRNAMLEDIKKLKAARPGFVCQP